MVAQERQPSQVWVVWGGRLFTRFLPMQVFGPFTARPISHGEWLVDFRANPNGGPDEMRPRRFGRGVVFLTERDAVFVASVLALDHLLEARRDLAAEEASYATLRARLAELTEQEV